MTYRGTVKDGVVVIAGNERPVDGSEVEIVVVEPAKPTIWQTMLEFSGSISGEKLPQDSARNLDHYLYGAPKK